MGIASLTHCLPALIYFTFIRDINCNFVDDDDDDDDVDVEILIAGDRF